MQTAIDEDSDSAVQPEIAVPFEVKPTVPVGVGGPEGLTVAVMVTSSPDVEGLGELITEVVLPSGFTTTCDTALEVLRANVPRSLIHGRQVVGPDVQSCIVQNCHSGVIQRGRSDLHPIAIEDHDAGRKRAILRSHGGSHRNCLPQVRRIRSSRQGSGCGDQLRRQLEHRPALVQSVNAGAAVGGRAVEIAGGIEDQAGDRISPVRAVAEAIQHLLRPAPARCGRQLEHRPVAGKCRRRGRAVEIAGGIEDQAGLGIVPVRAVAVEAMQHLLRPAPARVGVNSNTVPHAVESPPFVVVP